MIRVEFWYGGELRRITCDCQAARFSRACKHAGAVLHALRQRDIAKSQPETDPLASWRRGFACKRLLGAALSARRARIWRAYEES